MGREGNHIFNAIPAFLEWDTLVILSFTVISNAVMSSQPQSKMSTKGV